MNAPVAASWTDSSSASPLDSVKYFFFRKTETKKEAARNIQKSV